jgi:hypothetical protein
LTSIQPIRYCFDLLTILNLNPTYMKKILLFLLSAPTVLTIVAPIVTNTDRAVAAGVEASQAITPEGKFCVMAHNKLVCVKSSGVGESKATVDARIAQARREARDPDAILNFSDEESDAAAALFGCDCPACLRSLRQLRMISATS